MNRKQTRAFSGLDDVTKAMRAKRDAERQIQEAAPELFAAAVAALAYDKAIVAAAGDPERMTSFCTADGKDLDGLYLNWIALAQRAMDKATAGGRITALGAGKKTDAAQAVPSDAEIRAVFLDHGFTIKEGQTDLKPYVYEAARALLALAATLPRRSAA